MANLTPEEAAAADAQALADLEAEEAAIKQAATLRETQAQADAALNQAQADKQLAATLKTQEAQRRANLETVAGIQLAPLPPKPLQVVNLDEEVQAQVSQTGGQSFFFGDINLIKFKDGTSYHVTGSRKRIFDPIIIANLIEASKNPALKIFPE